MSELDAAMAGPMPAEPITPEQRFGQDIEAEVARMEAIIQEVDRTSVRFRRELTDYDAIAVAAEQRRGGGFVAEFVSDMAVTEIINRYSLTDQYYDDGCTQMVGRIWKTTMVPPGRGYGRFVAERDVETDQIKLFYNFR